MSRRGSIRGTMKRVVLPILIAVGLLAGCMSAQSGAGTPTDTRSVVVVGDSISAGAYLPQPWWDAWPMHERDELCGHACPVVTNLAVGGSCIVATCPGGTWLTYSGQNQLWSQVTSMNPKPTTIEVELGINDLVNVSNQWIENGLTMMKAYADSIAAVFLVATLTPLDPAMFHNFALLDPPRWDLNNWIRATYGDHVMDFDAVLRAPSADVADPFYYLTEGNHVADGLHPDSTGQMRMAQIVPLNLVK